MSRREAVAFSGLARSSSERKSTLCIMGLDRGGTHSLTDPTFPPLDARLACCESAASSRHGAARNKKPAFRSKKAGGLKASRFDYSQRILSRECCRAQPDQIEKIDVRARIAPDRPLHLLGAVSMHTITLKDASALIGVSGEAIRRWFLADDALGYRDGLRVYLYPEKLAELLDARATATKTKAERLRKIAAVDGRTSGLEGGH